MMRINSVVFAFIVGLAPMCTHPRAPSSRPGPPEAPTVAGVSESITQWLVQRRIEGLTLGGILGPSALSPDLIVKLVHEQREECGTLPCGAVLARTLERSRHAEDLFAHISAITGLPDQRIRMFVDVPPCWRRELLEGPDGGVSGAFTVLCKANKHPSECFNRNASNIDLPLSSVIDRYEGSLKLFFSGDTIALHERDANSFAFNISVDRARARVVPGSWESLEILAIFSATAEKICVQLILDGRHSPSGFRRPPEEEFLDLQPTYDRPLRSFGNEILDALRATMG